MTEQEAIKEFEERLAIADYRDNIPKYYEVMELAVKDMKEIKKYREIGTPEECRAAVEKQMAKRIIHEPNAGRERDWRCPNCDSYINPYAKYCIGCGQKLKGGGVNEYGRCGKSN